MITNSLDQETSVLNISLSSLTQNTGCFLFIILNIYNYTINFMIWVKKWNIEVFKYICNEFFTFFLSTVDRFLQNYTLNI